MSTTTHDRAEAADRYRRQATEALDWLKADGRRDSTPGLRAAAARAASGLYTYGAGGDLELAGDVVTTLARYSAEDEVDRVADALAGAGVPIQSAHRAHAAHTLADQAVARRLDELGVRRRNMGGDR